MTIDPAVVGAAIGLAGVVGGLLVNGDRAERQRRRDLHGRCLAAALAYVEMPFTVRRRRHEAEHRSEERARISQHFSQVQAELATCQVLLRADGDDRLATRFDALVSTGRRVAGQEAHDAWNAPPVANDGDMNMKPLFDRLAPFRARLEAFEADLANATLPRRKRVRRWFGSAGS